MEALALFGRTLLALAVVLGLVWAMSRLARRGQGVNLGRRVGRSLSGKIEVLDKKSLSRSSTVALIHVGEHNLIIGVTPQSVTLLSEITINELEVHDDVQKTDTLWNAMSGQPPTAWDAFISKLRELTVRS